MKLLLFDIDGTLISGGGAGERALRLALHERLGIEDDLSGIEIAGRTDVGIVRKILERHSIEPSARNVSTFLEGYLHHLQNLLPQATARLLPGVCPLLEALKAQPNVALGLLTGNLARGAQIKLTHFGLWHYFGFGAFADDHADRNALGPFAQVRARERHGVDFAPENTYILGDTPHDISCARAINAKAVAVTTGVFNREQLAAHQPDWIFEDFSDLDAVLAALT